MKTYFESVDFPSTPDAYFPESGKDLQRIAYVDLNLDGFKDIIVHISGEFKDSTSQLVAEKIPDSLIVFTSKKDGSYELANNTLFGQKFLSLGGAKNRKVEVGDFNSDGYPDIAYAMTLEDGRPQLNPPYYNWWSEIAVVMSNGDGSYRVDIVDIPGNWHSVTTLKVEDENPVLLFHYVSQTTDSTAIQHKDGTWNNISGIPRLTGNANIGVDGTLNPASTAYIFSSKLWTYDGTLTSGLYKKEGSDWSLIDQSSLAPSKEIYSFLTWNSHGTTYDRSAFDLKGNKVIDLNIWETKTLLLNKGDGPIVIALLSGNLLPADASTDEAYAQNDLVPYNYFVGFKIIDNKLSRIDDLVIGQEFTKQGYEFSVLDLNFDGYDDLVGYYNDRFVSGEIVANERIAIFINNGEGQLIKDDSFSYPSISHSSSSALQWPRASLVDLNSDGVMDIVYHATSPKSNDYLKVNNNDFLHVLLGTEDQFSSQGIKHTFTSAADQVSGSDKSDSVNTLAGNDYITTGNGNDQITSGEGDDIAFAGSGDDIFYGSIGNDKYYGGIGTDAVSIQTMSFQSISLLQDLPNKTWTLSSLDGSAVLSNIERVLLNDTAIAIDIGVGEVGGSCYRIYKAAFNRTPDEGGLGYWIGQMDLGKTLVEVSAGFINSDEFRASYGTNPTNGEFLTKVYNNVLGRDPDSGGYDWWVDQLTNNPEKTWDKVMADFSEGTENQANVLELIGNGVQYDLWVA